MVIFKKNAETMISKAFENWWIWGLFYFIIICILIGTKWMSDFYSIFWLMLTLFFCSIVFNCLYARTFLWFFFCYLLTFFNINFFQKFISGTRSNDLDPDQDWRSFGPALVPNCLKRLSTDNKSHRWQANI